MAKAISRVWVPTTLKRFFVELKSTELLGGRGSVCLENFNDIGITCEGFESLLEASGFEHELGNMLFPVGFTARNQELCLRNLHQCRDSNYFNSCAFVLVSHKPLHMCLSMLHAYHLVSQAQDGLEAAFQMSNVLSSAAKAVLPLSGWCLLLLSCQGCHGWCQPGILASGFIREQWQKHRQDALD